MGRQAGRLNILLPFVCGSIFISFHFSFSRPTFRLFVIFIFHFSFFIFNSLFFVIAGQYSTARGKMASTTRIFIGKLNQDVSESMLRAECERYGQTTLTLQQHNNNATIT
jgi:hypothetical protein